MEKMKMDEFAAKVCAAVKEKLGNDYRVDVKEVRKNNDVVLHGLMVCHQQQNVAPTIYLESFWEDYELGTSFEVTLSRILAAFRKEIPVMRVDMDFFQSFEKVRDRICYRLVNKRKNEELLEDVPHMEFLDLVLCFYYAYHGDILGDGTILIYNSHMEMWNTSTEELFRLAQDNTPRLFPWVCNSMREVLREVTGGMEDKTENLQVDIFQEVPMKVLGNQKRSHGAACILYPGVLEGIASKEGSLYIIPSSIHETILLPDDGKKSAEDLKEMIHCVNCTQVAPEEVLSDSLYYYDVEKKKIEIV